MRKGEAVEPLKTRDYIVCLKCKEVLAKKGAADKERLLRKCPRCSAGIKYLYLLGVVVDGAIEFQRDFEERSGQFETLRCIAGGTRDKSAATL